MLLISPVKGISIALASGGSAGTGRECYMSWTYYIYIFGACHNTSTLNRSGALLLIKLVAIKKKFKSIPHENGTKLFLVQLLPYVSVMT